MNMMQFGTSFTLPAFGREFRFQVVNAAVQDATTWVVHFLTLQSSSQAGTGLQTVGRFRADLIVGSAGVTDKFTIDYPHGGTIIGVTGETLRVEVFGQSPVPAAPALWGLPTLGAWAIPDARAADRRMSATLTDDTVLYAPAALRDSFIPARARAFRVLSLDAVHSWQTTQIDAALNTWAVDIGGSAAPATDTQAASRSEWLPLHPQADVVRLTNTGAAPASFSVQFVLELC